MSQPNIIPDAQLIDQRSLTELAEITALLAEAYKHYFETSDGYCKSSEGAVSLEIPPYFWNLDKGWRPGCTVYSYVLGPSRLHEFADTTEALREVRSWHAAELAEPLCPTCGKQQTSCMCDYGEDGL